ncbi:hypothetical protein TTHERM_000499371 (macronuclear) [Tetrahymena thermophila SB210]|uniref:Uncharacterized protein n=1 Tax=Tetrahymena thermophila (strain SB210) TaxID=312017 RepID=W7XHV3_TETTS|nr:hypothetical protein TTHERM_000499371 [Tetrahymena thermophila SB210]EWS72754.1 hypothetical protein TTHERM_000499371 [Tetrahymena thermophila SB210]|eukprot:XP_012654691.1 hypothetical protein TTHERM_000499371 [Tetrahymena thermophila SB210]
MKFSWIIQISLLQINHPYIYFADNFDISQLQKLILYLWVHFFLQMGKLLEDNQKKPNRIFNQYIGCQDQKLPSYHTINYYKTQKKYT